MRPAFIVLLVFGLASCAEYVITDRLNSYVASSFHEFGDIFPSCVKGTDSVNGVWVRSRACKLLAGETIVGKPIDLHIQSLSSKDLTTPLSGKRIDLELRDAEGIQLPAEAYILTPGFIVTDPKGRNGERIEIIVNKPGVYRVAMAYQDAGTNAFAFSPPLVVMPAPSQ